MIKVYAKLDEKQRITAVQSALFLRDYDGWLQIDEGEGDRYAHAQGNYFPCALLTEDSIPLYGWDGEKVFARSQENLAADRAALPEQMAAPSLEERLNAAEAALLAVLQLFE